MAKKKTERKSRQWSTAFTPKGKRGGVGINISHVPPTMRDRFSTKCRREGKSQRNLLLSWIKNWTAGLEPRWVPANELSDDVNAVSKSEAQAS